MLEMAQQISLYAISPHDCRTHRDFDNADYKISKWIVFIPVDCSNCTRTAGLATHWKFAPHGSSSDVFPAHFGRPDSSDRAESPGSESLAWLRWASMDEIAAWRDGNVSA